MPQNNWSAMNALRNALSKLNSWGYLLYAGTASLIASIKGYFYSHLLHEAQYAEINYYILIVGLGILFVGAGVVIRCHIELPALACEPHRSGELEVFLGNAIGVGGIFWVALSLMAILLGSLSDLSNSLIILSLIQTLFLFLITVDLLVEKSRGEFGRYAKQIFFRNTFVAMAGLSAAALWGDARSAILAEVILCFVFCLKTSANWFHEVKIPSRSFLLESVKFVPVTGLGALLQYVDRMFAAIYMSPSDFSKFSYFSLIIMAGISAQQLINTRVVTLLPALCFKCPRNAFFYVLKVAGGVFLLALISLTFLMAALRSDSFSADWVAIDLASGLLFVACAAIRAAEFFSSYLLAMRRRSLLILIQSISSIFFVFLTAYYGLYMASASIATYMLLMLLGFSFMMLLLFFFSWRVSLTSQSGD